MKPRDADTFKINSQRTSAILDPPEITLSPKEVMELAQDVAYLTPDNFYERVHPLVDPILRSMSSTEFAPYAQSCTQWRFLFQLRSKTSPLVHLVLGTNHGINYDRMGVTEDDAVNKVIAAGVKNAWIEIDYEEALPTTLDIRFIKKLDEKRLKDILSLESSDLHDVILDNLSNLLTDHVNTSVDTMAEMVKGLNMIVADLYVCGNARLNWFMYRMSWMLLMGKQGYTEHEMALLGDRNVRWSQRVLPKLNSAVDPHIIICGCNHLFGKHGMLQLLREAGWEPSILPVTSRALPMPSRFPEFAETLRRVRLEDIQNSRLPRCSRRCSRTWETILCLVLSLMVMMSWVLLFVLTTCDVLVCPFGITSCQMDVLHYCVNTTQTMHVINLVRDWLFD